MRVKNTKIPDVKILDPSIFSDSRGFFMETWREVEFSKQVSNVNFVQENQSGSDLGVVRGLHYQRSPKGQGKLVRVLRGAIFDVAVDIRKASSTFGKWVGVELSETNKRQLWIPEGFAHGFMSLSNSTEVLYKTTDYYSPDHEAAILWDDEDLGIAWPRLKVGKPILSDKDRCAPRFSEADFFDS